MNFLGKLSQSANMPQSVIINNQLDLDMLLNDASKEVAEIIPLGEIIQARVKTKQGFHRVAQKSSIILGAYVTSSARILMAKAMKICRENEGFLLYTDTGS